MMLIRRRLFNHPYLYSFSVASRASVCIATFIWSSVVVYHDYALSLNPNYAHMLTFADEDTWALVLGTLSLFMLWRLFTGTAPSVLGTVGYAILALLWTYLCFGTWIAPRPWPTGSSASTVLAILSLYAFISNPRKAACHLECDDAGPTAP